MTMFSDYIRRMRGDRTLADVANIAGIDPGALHKIENGHRPDIKVSTFLGLQKALKVPIENLVSAYKGIDPDKIKAPKIVLPEMPPEAEVYLESLVRFKREERLRQL